MTIHEYLHRPDHLRFVVAAPTQPHGPGRDLTALVLSAHQTMEAAKEAMRWERGGREIGGKAAVTALFLLDLESIETA